MEEFHPMDALSGDELVFFVGVHGSCTCPFGGVCSLP